jgi:hypothetical protein
MFRGWQLLTQLAKQHFAGNKWLLRLVHIIGSGGSLIASFMHSAVEGRLCNLVKL